LKAELWTPETNKNKAAGPHYLMHYKGWKATCVARLLAVSLPENLGAHSWDEWVPESRLLKLNEDNVAKQKQLNEAQLARDRLEREQGASASHKAGASAKRASEAPASGRTTKRARDAPPEQVRPPPCQLSAQLDAPCRRKRST
jgi:mortality factor 4-like protein 1